MRRYNEETKFSVTPSFVLTHSSDSIKSYPLTRPEVLLRRERDSEFGLCKFRCV